MTLIDAGENTRLEVFASVVAITCLAKFRTISFCFPTDVCRSIFLRRGETVTTKAEVRMKVGKRLIFHNLIYIKLVI